MTLLAEDQRVYSIWRNLLVATGVRGVQVHDAYLAATLEAHGVAHLLTFNTSDFRRFPTVIAVHPNQVQS
jgi:predicted nucleic acid-binding protein